MQTTIVNVDPAWAWSEFEPRVDTDWNVQLAAHLFRRAGFSSDWTDLQRSVEAGPKATIDRMFVDAKETVKFREEMSDLATSMIAAGDVKNLPAWWLYRMRHTPAALLEKVTLFWHGHFATSAAKVDDVKLMLAQNELLRENALGSFTAMVKALSRDPAMLLYLDSATNRKTHPNENYAREVMELFCLGLGNYTEHDIQEVARCFTGWEIRRGRFRFDRYQHDFGEKTVLGSTGEWDGDDAIHVILAQDAAPDFIVRKLVRYFVADEINDWPDALFSPLADELRESQFQIEHTVRRILQSKLFFSTHSIGRKVRSPVELTIGLLRSLESNISMYQLGNELQELGQVPFFPPNVKGWDGGRTWINSSTLLARANLVQKIVQGQQTQFAGGSLADLADKHGMKKSDETVDWLLNLLVAIPVPDSVRDQLTQALNRGRDDRSTRIAKTIHAVCTLPEFQLS